MVAMVGDAVCRFCGKSPGMWGLQNGEFPLSINRVPTFEGVSEWIRQFAPFLGWGLYRQRAEGRVTGKGSSLELAG